MSETANIVTDCPFCEAAMDITPTPPFSRVACPSCGKETRVKLEFGPYRLDRRLSVGGMSVLFVGHDKLLGREVAVKILNEEYSADEQRITAFEEEARVTASLSHPNIVRVLTTGRAYGRFFIAMELVPGGHLEHHIRSEEKIPEPRMVKLAIQIASGLKAAHEANLIHRDIKPGNILLDADGNAKIVDFGLALVTQGGTARAKEFWATPYYVPPESIEGAEEDFRSDIYAFGATLYHALAGKPPCDEESMALDLLRAAKKNIVPLRIAEPELSMDVCEIVDKAMAYEPNHRYASYGELLNDLQDCANRTKHGLTRESAGQASNRRSRARRSKRVALASAGFFIGIALIITLAWLSNRSTDPPPPIPTGQQAAPIAPGTQLQNQPAGLGVLYEEAHDAFTHRNYHTAADRFSRLHHHPDVLEPTRTWAGVQAIVAALLDEDGTRARQLCSDLRAHLSGAYPGDPEIAATLLPLFKKIEAGEPVVFEGDEPSLSGPSAVTAWLLAGIHEWQFGDHSRAATHFEIALAVALDDESQWASIYQDVARNHLADLALLDDPACHIEPMDPETAEEVLRNLESLRAKVITRGPISEILRLRVAHISGIRRWLMAQNDAEDVAAEPELVDPFSDLPPPEQPEFVDPFSDLPPPEEPPPAPPQITRADVFESLANYEFKNAREDMLRLPNDEIKVLERNALMQVARMAEKFMESLSQDVADHQIPVTELVLKSGQTITDIQSHPDRTPADREGNPIPWSKIHSDSFIDWHRERVQRKRPEDRIFAHEGAIALDLLAGDRTRALTAIQRLSETNPGFANYWKLILENYPN